MSSEGKNNKISAANKFETENTFKDLLPFSETSEVTEKFLNKVFELMVNYIRKVFDRNEKIVEFHHPEAFLEGIEGFTLELSEEPVLLNTLLQDCEKALKFVVKTGHPRHFNTLSSGLDIVSLAGEWLTSTANANIITYEFAPVFVMMENIVLKKMREIVGWVDGDGLFSPGGSISNMYAMIIARQKIVKNVKYCGMAESGVLVCFQSKHAHYSIKKNAAILGVGLDNAIDVDVDISGCIIPEDLENKILRVLDDEKIPFMVTATSGTTVVGAFDQIRPIHKICEKYRIWLHVDAAWGGGALMSPLYRSLLDGIHLADSVTWNPHKMMGIVLQCSAFLTKHEKVLRECNEMKAGYVFQPDRYYDSIYDIGDKSIQCGRHVDAFKLWLTWKAKGDVGFASHVEKCISLSNYLLEKLIEIEGYELVYQKPQYTNVCFWYIPQWLKKVKNIKARNEMLKKVAPTIKTEMLKRGSLMVTYQPLDENVNFFRMVISNPAVTKEDVDFVVDTIKELGEKIQISNMNGT